MTTRITAADGPLSKRLQVLGILAATALAACGSPQCQTDAECAQGPTITRTETLAGTATSSFAVGASLVVVGLNFGETASQNTVTFNDVPAASVSVDVGNATQRLIVTVPAGIPGAPTSNGGPALGGVALRVATPNTTPATTTITVTAPVATRPTITGVSSALVQENTDITISGTDFTQDASVTFRVGNNTPIAAAVSSRSATQIVARVPDFPEILPGPPTAVALMVSVPNQSNPQEPLVAVFQGVFNVVGATAQGPTIRTETLTGTATSSFAVGASLVVVGLDFSATASQNRVTFNDVPAASVINDPADPTRRLIVTVPSTITGAPTSTGGAPLAGVVLRVVTSNTTPATTTVTITAPVASQPTISDVTPATQFEGSNITIVGTNFTQNAEVLIRSRNAEVVSRTATAIVVKVPDFPDVQPGPPVPAPVVVSVPNPGDPQNPLTVFNGSFAVRGS